MGSRLIFQGSDIGTLKAGLEQLVADYRKLGFRLEDPVSK